MNEFKSRIENVEDVVLKIINHLKQQASDLSHSDLSDLEDQIEYMRDDDVECGAL